MKNLFKNLDFEDYLMLGTIIGMLVFAIYIYFFF